MMVNRHMERCSTLVIIGDMQIKITMRYHHEAIILKNLQINAGEGVKRTLIHLLMGTEMVQTIWKTV